MRWQLRSREAGDKPPPSCECLLTAGGHTRGLGSTHTSQTTGCAVSWVQVGGPGLHFEGPHSSQPLWDLTHWAEGSLSEKVLPSHPLRPGPGERSLRPTQGDGEEDGAPGA